jgi:hypothetical protein
MPSALDPARLRRAVEDAFADVEHPGPPEKIRAYPCCPDHDADAEWRSRHTWQDWARRLAEHTDAVEYSTLEPEAFRYFLPGILVHLIDHASRPADRLRGPLHWASMVLVPLDAGAEEFRASYLVLFSESQRAVVADVLRHLCARIPEDELDDPTIRKIERAVAELWSVKPA